MKTFLLALTTLSIPLTFNLLKWVNYNNYNILNNEFVTDYENDKVTIKSNSDFKVFVFNEGCDFSVVEDNPKDCEFYINTNFFDEDNNPIGLVVVDGTRHSDRTRGGGYFYVKDGNPVVSRKCPSYTDYSTQTILWGISNGHINNRLINMKHAKEETYRNVVGQNRKGDIIIVTSTFGSMVTIEEILSVGKTFDMVNAVLFDGGTSLDYKFNNGEYRTKFKSLPNWVGFILGYGNSTTYICVN